MALYTPPSLPHTPSSCAMNVPLPSLPIELLSTWSSWRSTKSEVPLTPPLSNAPSRRVLPSQFHANIVLPSITQLDRDLSRFSPDESYQWYDHSMTNLRLPPVHCCAPEPQDSFSTPYDGQTKYPSPSSPYILDWFSTSQHRSSQFIAEKTCEMICYLWFSTHFQSFSPSKRNCLDSEQHPSYIPHSSSTTASLQFSVSPAYIRFMQKVLETTQVSHSVIVLSLHYIYRMKARNRFTSGQAGSEYRVAVAALMMANKFVDDNTYTNKTWSEVSGIDLAEVNKMEKEFLLGIDFGLYVDKTTYDSWLNLLKGLVMAKERDSRHWRRSWRRPPRPVHISKGHSPKYLSAHCSRVRSTSHRARSSSPRRSSAGLPLPFYAEVDPSITLPNAGFSVSPSSGSKRSAADAFSPTPAFYPPNNPSKRYTGLTVEIPELESCSGQTSASSASPLEPLQSFAKLSIGVSPIDDGNRSVRASTIGENEVPQTLISAYRMDEQHPHITPQNLYFYTLACSPMEDKISRKARLRYQPPPPTSFVPGHYTRTIPMVVQSASASPYELHMRLPVAPTLPPFSEVSRGWPMAYDQTTTDANLNRHTLADDTIRSAPFANAGPSAVQFYNTTLPPLPPQNCRSRGRYI
ncbi:hypothetical protein AcW1_000181 [Taiwanofungus camphoratus]|nr:hypothetical protein AcW2_001325 [Antrodia cinnamomea]KAI0962969.1 hypothetical protein AcW1_000181 [Antrodia cinnamomea]